MASWRMWLENHCPSPYTTLARVRELRAQLVVCQGADPKFRLRGSKVQLVLSSFDMRPA